MGTLLLFFDGIGVGPNEPDDNPFAAADTRWLGPLAGRPPIDGTLFRPIDATLGVAGLPQSATGQTSLLTGINAARHVGRHQLGLPGPTLRPLIESGSLFLGLTRDGRKATFANAFTREHLEARRPRWSATTRSVMAAGLPFRMWDVEGRQGAALSHDFTGEWMRRRGFAMPSHDAASAAVVLSGLVATHDFVLYEYFLTDLVGHRGSWHDKLDQARRVEQLVDAVLDAVDLTRHRVLVTSDHGNLEEGRHKRHTRNPVPLMAWGVGASNTFAEIVDLTGIAPAILSTGSDGIARQRKGATG